MSSPGLNWAKPARTALGHVKSSAVAWEERFGETRVRSAQVERIEPPDTRPYNHTAISLIAFFVITGT